MAAVSTPQQTVDVPGDEDIDLASPRPASMFGTARSFVQTHRGPCAVAGTAILVLVALSLRSISAHAPLGHDESVYALRGSYYSGDYSETRSYYGSYRAPGLPFVLGLVFRVTGPSDVAARVTVLAFAVVFLIAVFVIGSVVASPWAGAAATVLTATTTTFARFSSLVFVDIAGIALATLAVALGLYWWRGDRLATPAYFVVPALSAAATEIRFGAPVTIACGMIGVVLLVWFRAGFGQRRRVAIEAAVLGTLTAGVCAFVLFGTAATAQNISPFEAQRAFRDAKGIPTWQSLEDVPRLIVPNGELDDMFHPIIFGLFLVGSVVALVDVARRRSSAGVGVAFSLVAGLLAVVALNFNLSHLEGQYLLAALPFGAVLAAIGIVSLWVSIARTRQAAATGLIVVSIGAAAFMTLWTSNRLERQAEALESNFRVIADAGFALRALDADDCIVVTGTTPQAGWYSQCAATPFVIRSSDVTLGDRLRSSLGLVPDSGPTFILFPNSGKRQPDADVVEADPTVKLVAERGAPVDGLRQWVRIFAVDDCVPNDACPVAP